MRKMDKRLLRMIRSHIGQFIAISLVISVGLLTFVSFTMAMSNLENSLNYYYDEANFADIYVETLKVPKKGVDDVMKISGVKHAQGRIQYDVPLKVEDENEKVTVRVESLPKTEYKINDLYFYAGKTIKAPNKDAYVFNQFAEARKIALDDIIRPQILGEEYALNVKAFVSSPEYVYLMENEQSMIPAPAKFGVLFVSEEFAMNSFGMNGYYNQILIKAEPGTNLDLLQERVENTLDRYGIKRIYQKKDQLSHRLVSEEIEGGKKMASTVPFIFLIVAASIMVIMISRTVKNDRVSIGVFKSMGYTNKEIVIHYTKYCLIIGFAGSVIGVALGMLLGAAMTQMYTEFFYIPYLKIVFHPGYLFLAIMLSALFSVGAGLMGARSVLGIHPAESMRPEPPKKGHRTVLEQTRLWTYLSFTEKIVVRNLLRSKKRFIFITLGIALTYAITMLPMFQANAFDRIFIRHYTDFLKMDYNINFTEPVNDSALNDIKHLIEFQDMDPKLEYPFEVEHTWKKKVVTVVGIPADTKMYYFKDINGSHVTLPQKGLFITEGLAKYLDVDVGEYLKINTFIPGRDDMEVRIVSIIDQSLGMNIYLDLPYMQDMFLERGLINGAMLTTRHAIKDELSDVPKISSVQSNGDLVKIFKEFLKLTLASVSTLIVFSGILGFAIVYNSSVMSLLERKLEFSSLRVMGFRKNEIFFILLRENVIMTILGIILGIPLGRALLDLMSESFSTELYTMKVDVPLQAYIVTGLLTFVFVFLAQIATYSRIHRLDFIEALKNRMT